MITQIWVTMNIYIVLNLSTFIPINLKNFTAKSNLLDSFLFISPKSLNFDIPLAFAATKKIIKNSSIAELLNFDGQFIDFKFFLLFT